MINWQPISEAPKDGTVVLLYAEDETHKGFYSCTEWLDFTLCNKLNPTHFSPINLPDEKPKDRYFIVFYSFNGGTGSIGFMCNGAFLNHAKAIEDVQKYGISNVSITNIIELSQKDYEQYYA